MNSSASALLTVGFLRFQKTTVKSIYDWTAAFLVGVHETGLIVATLHYHFSRFQSR